MRFQCVEGMDPILGPFVQVQDTKTGQRRTIFTGVKAWDRAQQRARELEEKANEYTD